MAIARSDIDLSPRRMHWTDRMRRGIVGVSLPVENSQSRLLTVTSSVVHVRRIHDPWFGARIESVSGPGTSLYSVSIQPQVAPRDGVVDGRDVIDEDNATWTNLNGIIVSLGTDELGGLKNYKPITDPRSDFDEEGVKDFLRFNLQITTSGTWVARDQLSVELYVNQGLVNLDEATDRYGYKLAEISELRFPEVEL